MNKILQAITIVSLLTISISCNEEQTTHNQINKKSTIKYPEIPFTIVLGIAQDAGYPQAACQKDCCKEAFADKSISKNVACLGIVDPSTNQRWIIDATPNYIDQIYQLDKIFVHPKQVDGILLTHGHIGHYTGLMHLGREVSSTKNTKVYAMPRMKNFLETNGPWSQLVKLKNIDIIPIEDSSIIQLNENILIMPFLVPHRDEFTETVGYKIIGKNKTLVFIPDIDKWSRWDVDIRTVVQESDCAYLDATFAEEREINNQVMDSIPHPFIVESIAHFKDLSDNNKAKIHFIHFNHSNPALHEDSDICKQVHFKGHFIATEGEVFEL